MTHHVILGAGPAGVIAAETIRKQDPQAEITLIGDEPEPPYSRMAIPYLLIGHVKEEGTYLRKSASHYADLKLNMLRAQVKSASVATKTIALTDGKTRGLRHAAGRHRLPSGAPAHTGHGRTWRAHLLDHGRRPQDHGAGHPGRASVAARCWFYRLHHHGGAGRARASNSVLWRWATAWCRA